MITRVPLAVLRAIGDWLPVAAAAALVVHLSWLGLRPALFEHVRLSGARESLARESADLAADEAELRELERAFADPIYQERLRWQWRLGAGGAASTDPESADGRALQRLRGFATRVDALPIDAFGTDAAADDPAANPPAAPPSTPTAADERRRIR